MLSFFKRLVGLVNQTPTQNKEMEKTELAGKIII